MPTHRLDDGRALIDGIADLGKALGYHVERELPVLRERSHPPAVDVAWLAAKANQYPLMIFEVESVVSNTAANNAVKVFSLPNERFEKPLFFFHVFLSGGTDTSRIESLRMLFGSHNYRVYRLDHDEATPLVLDMLSQHRRLRDKLNVPAMVNALRADAWRAVSLSAVFAKAEALGFDGNFLAEYARLGVTDLFFRDQFVRLLSSSFNELPGSMLPYAYDTYMGTEWSEPIHLGLMSLVRPTAADWLLKLRRWQEGSGVGLTRIGPHFGLARDYDDFVLGLAPVLWALVAALAYRIEGAGPYICDQYTEILKRLDKAEPAVSVFTAVWMLHVAASVRDAARFELARTFINERGGLAAEALYTPPSAVSIDEPDAEWIQATTNCREAVPPLDQFLAQLPSRYSRAADVDTELVSSTLKLLTDDQAVYDWGGWVGLLLHAPSGLTLRRALDAPSVPAHP